MKPDVCKKMQTVRLIEWKRPEQYHFAIAEEVLQWGCQESHKAAGRCPLHLISNFRLMPEFLSQSQRT